MRSRTGFARSAMQYALLAAFILAGNIDRCQHNLLLKLTLLFIENGEDPRLEFHCSF